MKTVLNVLKALPWKEVSGIVALLVSFSSLWVSFTSLRVSELNRRESSDISKIAIASGRAEGLSAYRNEIRKNFSENAVHLIKRVIELKGSEYLSKNLEKLKYVYFKQCIIKLVNSNRETFFQRHGLDSEFRDLMKEIGLMELAQLSRFIYSDDYSNITSYDLDELMKYKGNVDLSTSFSRFNKLLNSIDARLVSTNKELDEDYERMLKNNLIDTTFAKIYYKNGENKFGFVQSQIDFWKRSASKAAPNQTQELIFTYFDNPALKAEIEQATNSLTRNSR